MKIGDGEGSKRLIRRGKMSVGAAFLIRQGSSPGGRPANKDRSQMTHVLGTEQETAPWSPPVMQPQTHPD